MRSRLEALLGLRRSTERDAERALARAAAAAQAAEREQAQRDAAVTSARRRLGEAGTRRAAAPPPSAAAGQEWVRYLARLAAEVKRAEEAATTHRRAALARACATEAEARRAYGEARRGREAIEQIEGRARDKARRLCDRRAEDAASDLSLSRRAARDEDAE